MDLKQRIKESGLSIKEVAERMPGREGKIGIKQASMSSIISGNPTYNTLCDLAKVLNISVSELVRDDVEGTIEALIKDGGKFYSANTKEELLVIAMNLAGRKADWVSAYNYARNILVAEGKKTNAIDAINDFICKYENEHSSAEYSE